MPAGAGAATLTPVRSVRPATRQGGAGERDARLRGAGVRARRDVDRRRDGAVRRRSRAAPAPALPAADHERGLGRRPATCCCARRSRCPPGTGAGTVRVRVDNDVWVYLNGVLVGSAVARGLREPRAAGPFAFAAGRLQAGENVLAVRARDRSDQRYIDVRAPGDVRRRRRRRDRRRRRQLPDARQRRPGGRRRRRPRRRVRRLHRGARARRACRPAAARRSPRRSRTAARREPLASVRLVPPAGVTRAGRRGRAAPASASRPAPRPTRRSPSTPAAPARAATGRRPPAREHPLAPGAPRLALLPDGTALGDRRDGRLLAALRHAAGRGARRRGDQRHAVRPRPGRRSRSRCSTPAARLPRAPPCRSASRSRPARRGRAC